MNYVITYWVSPDTSEQRKDVLRDYFALQRKLKARMGGYQTIITNIDYDDVIPFQQPDGFEVEHGILAKWFGLGQAIDAGLKFPITMHDHDLFLRTAIDNDETKILSAYANEHYISDQIIIIPQACKDDVLNYIDRLRRFDYVGIGRRGDGCEVRHEGRFSSEYIQFNMQPQPFADTPKKAGIRINDLISFVIKEKHSLDKGDCECEPIGGGVDAVHGHLHKGQATDRLFDWLGQRF